jgi:AraC-like DNA-binding protein
MAQKAFTTITPVDTSEIEAVAALAKHCSNDTWRETKRILELRAAGWNMERIAKQLGISRPTAYRRLSDLTEVIASSEELCAKDAIRLVGETLAELHDLRCETMRQADADKLAVRNGGDPKVHLKSRARALRLALDITNLKVRVLKNAGVLKAAEIQNLARANKLAQAYVDQEMVEANLLLLDENYMLRENLNALREGKPEPYSDDDIQDAEKLREILRNRSRENTETLSEADNFLH